MTLLSSSSTASDACTNSRESNPSAEVIKVMVVSHQVHTCPPPTSGYQACMDSMFNQLVQIDSAPCTWPTGVVGRPLTKPLPTSNSKQFINVRWSSQPQIPRLKLKALIGIGLFPLSIPLTRFRSPPFERSIRTETTRKHIESVIDVRLQSAGSSRPSSSGTCGLTAAPAGLPAAAAFTAEASRSLNQLNSSR